MLTNNKHRTQTDMVIFMFSQQTCPQIQNVWIRHCNIDMHRLGILVQTHDLFKSRFLRHPGSKHTVLPMLRPASFGSTIIRAESLFDTTDGCWLNRSPWKKIWNTTMPSSLAGTVPTGAVSASRLRRL